MQLEDMILVSVDDHICEPADMWDNHLPGKWKARAPWTKLDLGGKKPSEIFREHIITCFIDDVVGIETRDHIGLENITWECDYPHSDTTWPEAPEPIADIKQQMARALSTAFGSPAGDRR